MKKLLWPAFLLQFFLKNANKPLADLETEVVVIDEDSQSESIKVENIQVSELE